MELFNHNDFIFGRQIQQLACASINARVFIFESKTYRWIEKRNHNDFILVRPKTEGRRFRQTFNTVNSIRIKRISLNSFQREISVID